MIGFGELAVILGILGALVCPVVVVGVVVGAYLLRRQQQSAAPPSLQEAAPDPLPAPDPAPEHTWEPRMPNCGPDVTD